MSLQYAPLTPELLLYCIKINPHGEELLAVLKKHTKSNDEQYLMSHLIQHLYKKTNLRHALFHYFMSSFSFELVPITYRLMADYNYLSDRLTQ